MLKVLIADDEYKVGFLVKKLIEWDKLNLEFAGLVQDGMTAYEKICECTPDIVITDIRMPRVSGLDLSQMTAENNGRTKVIIISGYSDFTYARQALRYGVSEYLVKPVLKQDLAEAVERLVPEMTAEEI